MSRKWGFLALAAALLGLLVWAYSNHFHNEFHFDDNHTIVNNQYIRDVSNIPLFFGDATTTSSLPANQAYRPGLTALNAIDYWIAGSEEPQPFWFHVDIFATYVVLCFLLFLLFRKVFQAFDSVRWYHLLVLLATGWYALHTANAETINYIIARSDSFSTLMVVLAFVMYLYWPLGKRLFLYLVPIVIGVFVKEPTVMFAPLLLFYHLLIERDLNWLGNWRNEHRKALVMGVLLALPAFVIGGGYFLFSRAMTPDHWVPTGIPWDNYLITQPFVIVHYFNNFLLPVNLSADTDWEALQSVKDDRFITGMLFLFALLAAVVASLKRKATRPVAFGILWFLVALFPTSSIFPLGEVLNDHRTFFPYIGLVIAGSCVLANVLLWLEKRSKSAAIGWAFATVALMGIAGHAVGVHQRNEVWRTGESLWRDVTEKSPKNARGLMNYGNALMAKGDYAGAQSYFERAKALWPNYAYIHVNLGVLHGAKGEGEIAESYFQRGQQLQPNNPTTYFYYGRWLSKNNRIPEAITQLRKCVELAPNRTDAATLLAELEAKPKTELERLLAQTQENPTHGAFLDLSLQYYFTGDYLKCIEAAEEALKLKPDYALAYNNICSAYNALEQWQQAAEACEAGLAIDPEMQLMQNNLKVAQNGLAAQ